MQTQQSNVNLFDWMMNRTERIDSEPILKVVIPKIYPFEPKKIEKNTQYCTVCNKQCDGTPCQDPLCDW